MDRQKFNVGFCVGLAWGMIQYGNVPVADALFNVATTGIAAGVIIHFLGKRK